jgi:hypothetical protein
MEGKELTTMSNKAGSLMYVDPAAVAAAESSKARIQSAYIMAMQRPRDVDVSRDRILKACKRSMFAEKVEFSKPVGGKQIKGPSIRFAELALREWGNILSDVQVLYEDDTVRRSRVLVIDLETNASFSKEIQVTKTVERKKAQDREVISERINTNNEKVYIVKATDDELHNKEAALISKALRNEGLRIIPSDIIDESIEVAKATLAAKDREDPDAARKKVLDAFSEIGVKPKDLEKYLGHKTDTLNPKELADLRSIYRAIKDGEATWLDYTQEKAPGDPGPKATADDLKKFKKAIPKGTDDKLLEAYLKVCADHFKKTVDEVKVGALADMPAFLQSFTKWAALQGQKAAVTGGGGKKEPGDVPEPEEMAPAECPNSPGSTMLKKFCENQCKDQPGCPVWE